MSPMGLGCTTQPGSSSVIRTAHPPSVVCLRKQEDERVRFYRIKDEPADAFGCLGKVTRDVGKSADAEPCPAAPCTPYGTSAPYQRALEATRDLWKIVRQEAALKDE